MADANNKSVIAKPVDKRLMVHFLYIMFIQDSEVSTYANMWTFMNSNKNVFTSSVKEGVERVRKEDGNYAFFAESTAVEYIVGQHCDLKQVGGLLDSKGFGIGLPKSEWFHLIITFT